jgi:hypothetical protein
VKPSFTKTVCGAVADAPVADVSVRAPTPMAATAIARKRRRRDDDG